MTNTLPGFPDSLSTAKAEARRAASALKRRFDLDLPHGHALEFIAQVHGEETWGHLKSKIDGITAGAPLADDVLFRGRTWPEIEYCLKAEFNDDDVLSFMVITIAKMIFATPAMREQDYHREITSADLRRSWNAVIMAAGSGIQGRLMDVKKLMALLPRTEMALRELGRRPRVSQDDTGVTQSVATEFPDHAHAVTADIGKNRKHPCFVLSSTLTDARTHVRALGKTTYDLTDNFQPDLDAIAHRLGLTPTAFASPVRGLDWLMSFTHFQDDARRHPPQIESAKSNVIVRFSDILACPHEGLGVLKNAYQYATRIWVVMDVPAHEHRRRYRSVVNFVMDCQGEEPTFWAFDPNVGTS